MGLRDRLWKRSKGRPAWDREAEKALAEVPAFVRPMVRSKVEHGVGKQGKTRVTARDFQEARQRFQAVFGGMDKKEVQSAMPAPNRPGASLTVVQVCRGTLSDCPNPLINAEELEADIQKWIGEKELNERLRQRVKTDRILFHHKLKISVSSCPNGCARHQTADLGITGWVRPRFDLENCTKCGACIRACPDQALSLEKDGPVHDQEACQGCHGCLRACASHCVEHGPAGYLLLAGGKLGRHPHLADPVGIMQSREELLKAMDDLVESFLEESRADERFADWWLRTRAGTPASGKRVFFGPNNG